MTRFAERQQRLIALHQHRVHAAEDRLRAAMATAREAGESVHSEPIKMISGALRKARKSLALILDGVGIHPHSV